MVRSPMQELPPPLAMAVRSTRVRLNAWVALDAAAAGLCVGAGTAACDSATSVSSEGTDASSPSTRMNHGAGFMVAVAARATARVASEQATADTPAWFST